MKKIYLLALAFLLATNSAQACGGEGEEDCADDENVSRIGSSINDGLDGEWRALNEEFRKGLESDVKQRHCKMGEDSPGCSSTYRKEPKTSVIKTYEPE